jgi:hypothetical protein
MVSSADRVASSSARTSAASALARACPAVCAPGITTLTPGWSITQRNASCAVVTPGGVAVRVVGVNEQRIMRGGSQHGSICFCRSASVEFN